MLGVLASDPTEAVESNGWATQLRLANRMMLDALGLAGQAALLLDRAGTVIDVNRSAQAMLDDGRLVIRDGQLTAPDAASAQNLVRTIQQCLAHPDQGGERTQIAGSTAPIGVHCVPFPAAMAPAVSQQAAAVVMIADPRHRMRQKVTTLTRRHGLTHAEAELAVAVVETGSRKAAAQARGVSDTTARSQLTSIFDKTGVRRQTELVRLLLDES